MRVGMVGLGRMGANMARRLMRGGHEVVATDLNEAAVAALAEEGAVGAADLAAMIGRLEPPRVVWLMVPSGAPTESSVVASLERLEPGDVLVDGANSFWKDSMRRGALAAEGDVHFVDAGVSGGVWGLEEGYNLMVGGSDGAIAQVEPLLAALAPPHGYRHLGPTGTGHFVKMVHNGIEYALLEAYGEGFEALARFPHHEIDLHATTELWTHGSVIRSWLLELAVRAFADDGRLDGVRGYVDDSGMGRWTVDFGVEHEVAMPAISAALFSRFRSRQPDTFTDKVVAALRNQFGGHAVKEL